jgi:ketosteroid isomerase-like protein
VKAQKYVEPLDVVRRMFTCFEQKDLAGVMEFVDPQSSWFFPGDPKILPWAGWYRGAGLMRFFIICTNTLEYLSYHSHTFHAAGEYVTVLGHECCRVKLTNRIFENDLVQVVRVMNGKIVEFLEFSDTAAMQAGFLPQTDLSEVTNDTNKT